MEKISRTISRSINIFSIRDKRNLYLVCVIQVLLGLLDLIGVALIGVLGALAVNGVQSKQPGNRVSKALEILGIENLQFQNQIALIGILASIFMIGRTIISIVFTRRILFFLSKKSADLSSKLVEHLFSRDFLFIQSQSSQQHLFAVTSGVNHITVGVIGSLVTLVSDISLLLVLSAGLFILDPVIALSTFGMFFFIGVTLYLLMQKRARYLGEENSKMQVKSNELILEAIETYRELTVRGRKSNYLEKISNGRLQLARNNAEMAFMPNISKYVIETSVVFGALVIAATQFLTQDATRAVGILSVFLAAGSRIAPAVLRMQQGAIGVRSSIASARPTLTLIENLTPTNITKQRKEYKKTDVGSFTGDVLINNISFTYPVAKSRAIDNLSLEIEANSSVALVGPSGAGKSTLADLILGILKPTNGNLLISGTTPEEIINNFPGYLAYVPQDIRIIDGTIRENICLGFNYDDFTDEQVWKCLEKAQLDHFVSMLPQQLDSSVGEGGSKISGGQRQRLGIARALLTSPKLLILDEATSALDGKTENEITKAIQVLKKNLTVITVAHRLSTVIESDLVVYIDKGQILAKGSFREVEKMVPEFAEQAALLKK